MSSLPPPIRYPLPSLGVTLHVTSFLPHSRHFCQNGSAVVTFIQHQPESMHAESLESSRETTIPLPALVIHDFKRAIQVLTLDFCEGRSIAAWTPIGRCHV